MYFSAIAILLFLSGCKNDTSFNEINKELTADKSDRTNTLTASMPKGRGNEPTTRIDLTHESDKSITLTWEEDDQLELVFVQGDTKIKSIAKVVHISGDEKNALFHITLPKEIKTGEFDLYGVYGGGGLSDNDPTLIKLPENAGSASSLASIKERKDVMLHFASKNININNPKISVTFQHLGSLFSINVKNTSSKSLSNLAGARLVGVSGDGKWAYNTGVGGNMYDLVNGEFLNQETAGNYVSFKAETNSLSSGKIITFWGWYPTLPDKSWPELKLDLRSESESLFISSNSNPERDTPTVSGKSYYLFATWDGSNLEFSNESFFSPRNPSKYIVEDLVNKSNVIGELLNDTTYTVVNSVVATEISYKSIKGYAMKMFVMTVDLNDPDISIETALPNGGTKFGFQTIPKMATYVDKVGHKVWAGVNGDFHGGTGIPSGVFHKNGLILKDTTTPEVLTSFFGITKNRKALVGNQSTYNRLKEDLQEAMGCRGVWLLRNGRVVTQSNTVLEPRTCIGVSKDSTIVYIMAIDGRQSSYSNGMQYAEMSDCFKAIGAENAANLDGGGSTTFFIRNTPEFTSDRFEVRNRPSNKDRELRAVANGLLVISKSK
ncbi:MAG: phosphodiester glycosidase family protein [Dysgonamonadaceae bacterium]|nr:phosphodiester glycosidase family protein [Dysgonamonadaceae bacterium]